MTTEERIDKITSLVSEGFGVSEVEIRGDSAQEEIVRARHICKWICAYYGIGRQKIVSYYGHSSHSSVKWSIDTINNLLVATDPKSKLIASDIKRVKGQVAEALGFPLDIEFENPKN